MWGERSRGPLSKSLQPVTSQRQTNGVAVTVNCNGPRLTLTTLIKYVPLWLTVEFSTATPFVASTVCSATPEGFTSTIFTGTFRLDSATNRNLLCACRHRVIGACLSGRSPVLGWFVVLPPSAGD